MCIRDSGSSAADMAQVDGTPAGDGEGTLAGALRAAVPTELPVTAFAATASPAGAAPDVKAAARPSSKPRISAAARAFRPGAIPGAVPAPGSSPGSAAARTASSVGTAARSAPASVPSPSPAGVPSTCAMSAAELPLSVAVAITNPLSPKSRFSCSRYPPPPRKISTAAAAAAIRGQWLRNTEIRG